MAKYCRCENCNHEEPLKGSLEQVPPGWVDATERKPGSEPNRDFLACSPGCMMILMRARAAERDAELLTKRAGEAAAPSPDSIQ